MYIPQYLAIVGVLLSALPK